MKVYIVVAGQYSDYHIERVFLDKEKADRYVELSHNSYDPPYIRTMETSDDCIIDKITYVEVYYTKGKGYEDIDADILVTNTIDSTEDNIKRNEFYLYLSGSKELDISRVIYGDFNEDDIKEKYKKVCYDLMSKIESLVEIEGWTEEMIDEWLNQNVDNYIKN